MRHVNRNAAAVRTTLLSWQEALAIVERCDAKGVPIPFAIAFCTADEEKGTGGEVIRYDAAVWHVKGGRVNRTAEFERVGTKANPSARSAATPVRRSGWTRNIRGIDSDQIRRIHLHLILEINGQPVR